VWPLEKSPRKLARGLRWDTFSGAVLKARPAELGQFSAILAVTEPDFSAAQTVWRRGRDSNPRYYFCRLATPRTKGSQVGFAKSSVCDRQQFASQVCKVGPLLGPWRKRAIERLVVTQHCFLWRRLSEKHRKLPAISCVSSVIQ
jgi:hypothetical protein